MISIQSVIHNVIILFPFINLRLGYYFRVSNTKKNKEIKFNVLNLAKPDSLYNDGMKVLIFSEKEH